MYMINIKSYESKDLQTFFEVLRLKKLKDSAPKPLNWIRNTFQSFRFVMFSFLLWITRTIMLRPPETIEFNYAETH